MLNRREFAKSLGIGFLAVGLGGVSHRPTLAWPGMSRIGEPLDFGPLESLAVLMQETEASKLLPLVVQKLKSGTALTDIAAAASLANARTFGGEDYVGYHCAMSVVPALEMAAWMPEGGAALPTLKLLVRNTTRMRECGGREKEKMKKIAAAERAADAGSALLAAERALEAEKAMSILSAEALADPARAMEILQPIVRENIDVHQVVLAWRSWDLIRIAGRAHADTLLVAALRQCLDREAGRVKKNRPEQDLRQNLGRVLAERKPALSAVGKPADDARIEKLAQTFFASSNNDAMAACVDAMLEGLGADAIGEAMSVASARLLLCDKGRRTPAGSVPAGTVHGATVGLHAIDSANAWRHIAEVAPREAVPTLLAGAWHTGGQSVHVEKEPFHTAAAADAEKIAPEKLIDALDQAVAAGQQALAAAIGERIGKTAPNADQLFRKLAGYYVDDDGFLHHEKFFFTCVEEYRRARPAFRGHWTAVAARVAASARGIPAPGVAEARGLLKG
jgi:hypothetical protein